MKLIIIYLAAVICYGCYPRPYYEGRLKHQANATRYESAPAQQPAQRYRLTESFIYGLGNADIYSLDVVIEGPLAFGWIRIPARSKAKIYATHKAYSILGGLEKILYATFPEYNRNDVLTLRFDAKGGVYTLTDVYWGLPSARKLEFIWSARSMGNYLLVKGDF